MTDTRAPAEWRSYLTEAESQELAEAEHARTAASERLRVLTARLKARCLKRKKRAKGDPTE